MFQLIIHFRIDYPDERNNFVQIIKICANNYSDKSVLEVFSENLL